MERIRRSKKRNYTIFIILAALLLTAGYATFVQPLAHRLQTLLLDNSRFGPWHSEERKDANNNNTNTTNTNTTNKGNTSYNNNNNNNNNYDNIITKQWDIGFIDAKKVDSKGNTAEMYPVSFENLFATFYVLLSDPGDYITYEFTIKNKGTIDAKLDGYDIVTTNNDIFKFKVENIEVGEALDVGKTKKIKITTTYNSEYSGDDNDSQLNTGKISVSLRYVQK